MARKASTTTAETRARHGSLVCPHCLNNQKRQEAAQDAVDRHVWRTDDSGDRETNLQDLITNLMHLAFRDGYDWNDLTRKATANFNVEYGPRCCRCFTGTPDAIAQQIVDAIREARATDAFDAGVKLGSAAYHRAQKARA
jgi:hypothetical protein